MRRKRVPTIHQMSSFDCGPACLAMVLGYLGRKTRLEECSARCDPGRDGTTARALCHAAEAFGLVPHAYRAAAAGLATLPAPLVLHWNRNHFVVLERCTADGALIVDPSLGRREVSRAELETSFSGTALRFEPGPAFDRTPGQARHPLLIYFRQMLAVPGTAGLLMRILAASLVLQCFGFALPLLTKVIVDGVPAGAASLHRFALGAVLAALAQPVLGYARARVLLRLEERLDSHMMREFFSHLLSLPFRFFQIRNNGDLVMRLGSNAAIREAVASTTASAILDGSLVLVFLAALFHYSTPMALAALAFAAVEMVVLAATSHHLYYLVQAHLSTQAATQSCLVESLMGILTVKTAGAEQATLSRWSGLLGQQLEASRHRGAYAAQAEAAMGALRLLAPICLLWLGAMQVLEGSLTLGTMLAVNGLAAVFLQPVHSLVMSAQRLQLAGAHMERILDVMEAQPEQTAALPTAQRLSGGIELRHVSFRYDSHSPLVLDGVSLVIRPGQKVALVGRTGSGKSTLAKLLLGLYQPTGGEILYDGARLQDLDLSSVRRQWGTALQEPFLFSSSLRENIAMMDPSMPEERVREAARLAEIHQDIERMPMGYETRVDEAGQSLSGGQRQRIAMARALAARPALMLFDETTSHLDTVTEAAVQRNLDQLGCTRVIIAQRLSTVRNADVIYVLDHGTLVEQGSHEELVARGGAYARLVSAQVEDGVEVERWRAA